MSSTMSLVRFELGAFGFEDRRPIYEASRLCLQRELAGPDLATCCIHQGGPWQSQ